jgi:hypothetical protein
MTILHSTEARESWKNAAEKMREKIGTIPGDVLSYSDAGCIARILSMFCEYVQDEEKRVIFERNLPARPRVIVEVDSGMVQRVLSDRKVDVDVLDMDNYNNSEDEEEISAYEDMICEASLLQKVW